MFHWTYTEIFGKLTRYCEDQVVIVRKLPSSYASQQRCTKGGWVQKTNRNGKTFECQSCGHAADAYINAAINIGSELSTLSNRKLLDNNNGFYWNLVDQEQYIVPDYQKTLNNIL